MDTEPQWRLTVWETVRIEGVPLNPGTANTIEIESGYLGLDDVLVTTADDLAAAFPHRRVRSLTATRQLQLNDYLRQLDGRDESGRGPRGPRQASRSTPSACVGRRCSGR